MNFLIRYLKSIFIDLNIQGQSNEFVYINKGKEFPIRIKNKTFEFKINGNNNKVRLVGNLNQKSINKVLSGLKLNINGNNNLVEIEMPIKFQKVVISIQNDDNVFKIQTTAEPVREATFYIEGKGQVLIGKNSQLKNRGLYVVVNGNYKDTHKLIIGNNVYIAKDTLIRTSDGHTLIDLETNKPLSEPKDVIIGNNVWITSKCTILKGTELADNTIVGACSLVNKKFNESNILIAGIPAKIIKKNVNWSTKDYGEYMESLEIGG